MFEGRYGQWQLPGEITCFQERYLPKEVQGTGLICYHNIRYLLLLPRLVFKEIWSNDSSRAQGTPKSDTFGMLFFSQQS